MIEYAKRILPLVCNWKDLFRKELVKCAKWAEPEKYDELFNWCCRHYAEVHPDVLEEVFQTKTEKSSGNKPANRLQKIESAVE